MSNKPTRIDCPKCGRNVSVTKLGRLRTHGVDDRRSTVKPVPRCPMSGTHRLDLPKSLSDGEADAMTRIMGGGQ